MTAADLPPFDFDFVCRACASVRGRSEKWPMQFCVGNDPDPHGPRCPEGIDGEHVHVKCMLCSYSWAIQVAGAEPPLTAAEIRAFRELVSLPVEAPVPEAKP